MVNRNVIVRTRKRPDEDAVAELQRLGVATVHEAMGRRGLTEPVLRQIFEENPKRFLAFIPKR